MTGRLVALICAVVLIGGPAQASQTGPSVPTYEPASTISAAHLRTMKYYGWDVRNVAARHTKVSREQAITIVGGADVSRVSEAALTRVRMFDSARSQLMWAVITVTKIRSTAPWTFPGPLIREPDPRTVTKVDPLTGDVMLPPSVRHPAPLRTWTTRTVMLVDPDTGDEPAGMSL